VAQVSVGGGSEEAIAMSGLIFLVLDTETTGPDEHDQPVEVGHCATDLNRFICYDSVLVKATIPIAPGASAVHHLLDDDLVSAPELGDAVNAMRTECLHWADAVAYVAHNAPFDRPKLPMLADKPWLDTLRMARRYLPEAASHSNQFLRYFLKLDVPRNLPAHRTLCDCLTTAALLRFLLTGPARDDFERLGVVEFIKHVDSPLLLEQCNFGKHQGNRWADVPRDYLAWICSKQGFDPDVTFTAQTYLRGPQRTFPHI
jgi:exodeoxyribonuclease X